MMIHFCCSGDVSRSGQFNGKVAFSGADYPCEYTPNLKEIVIITVIRNFLSFHCGFEFFLINEPAALS